MFSVKFKRSVAMLLVFVTTVGVALKYERRDVQAMFVVDDAAVAAVVIATIAGLLVTWGIQASDDKRNDIATDFWNWLCDKHEDFAAQIYKNGNIRYAVVWKQYIDYQTGGGSNNNNNDDKALTSMVLTATVFRALSIFFKQWSYTTEATSKYFMRPITSYITTTSTADELGFALSKICTRHSENYSDKEMLNHENCYVNGVKITASDSKIADSVYKVYEIYTSAAKFNGYYVSDGSVYTDDGTLLGATLSKKHSTVVDDDETEFKAFYYETPLVQSTKQISSYKYVFCGQVVATASVIQDDFEGLAEGIDGVTLDDDNIVNTSDSDGYAQNYLNNKGALVTEDEDDNSKLNVSVPFNGGDYERALQSADPNNGSDDDNKNSNNDGDNKDPTDSDPDSDPDPDPDPDDDTSDSDDDKNNTEKYRILDDLTGKFPFCIPFDFADFVGVLSADPVAPKFDWTFTVPMLNLSVPITIDLSGLDEVALIIRRMELLAFCLGLILITRNMIRG